MEKYFKFEIKKFYSSSGRPQAPLFTTEQAVSRLSETPAPVFFLWEKYFQLNFDNLTWTVVRLVKVNVLKKKLRISPPKKYFQWRGV